MQDLERESVDWSEILGCEDGEEDWAWNDAVGVSASSGGEAFNITSINVDYVDYSYVNPFTGEGAIDAWMPDIEDVNAFYGVGYRR